MMRHAAAVAAALCAMMAAVAGAHIEGRIYPNEHLTSLAALDVNARVLLNGGELAAVIRADGSFAVCVMR